MRQRLKRAGSYLSSEAALADLRRIQRHTVRIDDGAPIQGVSNLHQRQTAILAALSKKTRIRGANDTAVVANSNDHFKQINDLQRLVSNSDGPFAPG